MENTRKIILSFLTILFLYSCLNQEKRIIKNSNFIIKDSTENIVFKILNYNKIKKKSNNYYLKNDSIFYKNVSNQLRKDTKLTKVIDVESFDLLYNDEQNKVKINNQYYITNPILNYFKDKNNVYIYKYLYSNSKFFIAGKSNEYVILGGAYLQIKDKIYWRGEEMKNIDLSSFKTLQVQRINSEWKATIGIDKKNLYNGDQKITLEMAKRKFNIDEDLINMHFHNYNTDK